MSSETQNLLQQFIDQQYQAALQQQRAEVQKQQQNQLLLNRILQQNALTINSLMSSYAVQTPHQINTSKPKEIAPVIVKYCRQTSNKSEKDVNDSSKEYFELDAAFKVTGEQLERISSGEACSICFQSFNSIDEQRDCTLNMKKRHDYIASKRAKAFKNMSFGETLSKEQQQANEKKYLRKIKALIQMKKCCPACRKSVHVSENPLPTLNRGVKRPLNRAISDSEAPILRKVARKSSDEDLVQLYVKADAKFELVGEQLAILKGGNKCSICHHDFISCDQKRLAEKELKARHDHLGIQRAAAFNKIPAGNSLSKMKKCKAVNRALQYREIKAHLMKTRKCPCCDKSLAATSDLGQTLSSIDRSSH